MQKKILYISAILNLFNVHGGYRGCGGGGNIDFEEGDMAEIK